MKQQQKLTSFWHCFHISQFSLANVRIVVYTEHEDTDRVCSEVYFYEGNISVTWDAFLHSWKIQGIDMLTSSHFPSISYKDTTLQHGGQGLSNHAVFWATFLSPRCNLPGLSENTGYPVFFNRCLDMWNIPWCSAYGRNFSFLFREILISSI